ncbi:valine--pyruvate transaminase [Leptospira ognonensis]|uniref:Valine--pyruvate transaminase n=1 Tax=Leptospira ognonensis TaxID=2484945 RepID=A0A4R9JY46_9LEPT|nr:valine--pyruvate transaminase [Leptospira ognonensis]TGL57115.1 valine--pyruvate transaminase [Leptospira ognonensis]
MLRSRIAKKLTEGNGILSLMSDLSETITQTGDGTAFLGGGNPAKILEAEKIYESAFSELANQRDLLANLFGDYAGPIGNKDIRALTAAYLSQKLNASLTYEHIAFFNGSQNAFSYLLNAYSGNMEDGSFKKICLPIVPEYIGYADQTWDENVFQANLPQIEILSTNRFRYQIDQKKINLNDVGCIALSRPTNPTGNIITSEELTFLYTGAKKFDIPLLIDLAYGNPFPNLIGNSDPVMFDPGKILSLSFSKVGLPGIRFGIIIADPYVIETLSAFGAVGNLSSGNVGAELARIFWANDTLTNISNNILRPYYEKKCKEALEILDERFQSYGIEYSIHSPDGGFFLWIYFPELKISNQELYSLCKLEKVYIVSGHYFFPGLSNDFSHREKCIRLTYCRSAQEIARGAEILAKLVSQYSKNDI